jgi:hypothetical protein
MKPSKRKRLAAPFLTTFALTGGNVVACSSVGPTFGPIGMNPPGLGADASTPKGDAGDASTNCPATPPTSGAACSEAQTCTYATNGNDACGPYTTDQQWTCDGAHWTPGPFSVHTCNPPGPISDAGSDADADAGHD